MITCQWCDKEYSPISNGSVCPHCGEFQPSSDFGRFCRKHNKRYNTGDICPRCREESLPVQYSRGKNKLFKE